MIWRGRYSPTSGEIDPEREQELRLVAQARAGAAWATSALIARYQPLVVRYLVRLVGEPERAGVLAEHLFVRMGKRLRGPHAGEHLRLWLLRAATEMGLDVLRHPDRALPPRLTAPAGPAALLTTRDGETPIRRLVATWNGHARAAGSPRPAPRTQRFVWEELGAPALDGHGAGSADQGEWERLSPREALRHRMVRAVLAELPYGDAQCLALHLVAGLNQSEVAQALGVAAPVARRRIVQGLQIFGRRYDAALASLGLPEDFDARANGPAHADHADEEVAMPLLTLREVAVAETASAPGLADDSAALSASTDGAERHESVAAPSSMLAVPSDDPRAASAAEANVTSGPVAGSAEDHAGRESPWQRDARASSRVETELAVIVVEADPSPMPGALPVDRPTPTLAAGSHWAVDSGAMTDDISPSAPTGALSAVEAKPLGEEAHASGVLGGEAAGATDAGDGRASGPAPVVGSPHGAELAASSDRQPDLAMMPTWEARRARVLSADGEAEDTAVTQVMWRTH